MHLVKGGGSYASTSDHTLHFGLGDQTVVDELEIHWPGGTVQKLAGVAADQVLSVIEQVE